LTVGEVLVLSDRRYVGDDTPTSMPESYVANVKLEDQLVVDALERRGWRARRVAWCDPAVEWTTVDAAILRTTWDYFDRWEAFSTWLSHVQTTCTLLNPPAVLHWNLDKHYLLDLHDAGVNVVPTRCVSRGSKATLASLVADMGWTEDVVIKPTISGAAKDTYHLTWAPGQTATLRPTAPTSDIESLWQALVAHQDMLVQPFLPSVVDEGERSLIWIDGEITHAVSKHAKTGDFRVQDDHGGTVRPHPATHEEREFACDAMAKCLHVFRRRDAPAPVVARVDMVRDLHGNLAVAELEMVEPELWFRMAPHAADSLAGAITRRLLAPGMLA
jgi:glutathione synthase/RimK-type ligase-like ATP-grasp enzyme